jgi:hypothetical protein
VWKCIGDQDKVLSTGFVLFRKITQKEKDSGKFPPERKLVSVLKYKKRFTGEE